MGSRQIVITLFCILFAYFLGNVSPATLLGRLMGVDIRREGSGNPGTTNVLRVLGKKAAALTLLIDAGKGVIAVLVGRSFGAEFGVYGLDMLCAFFVFLGHIYPAAFGFKGGKGVATGFGALLMLCPPLGLAELAVAALGMLLSRRVSVGSLAAGVFGFIAPEIFMKDDLPWSAVTVGAMGALLIWRHRSNLARLLRGEEPTVNFRKSK